MSQPTLNSKNMANKVSEQTSAEAEKIAKNRQRPNQTKEQTKLIAQGIEKGIAEYKKQQKAKARERDKFKKQQMAKKVNQSNVSHPEESTTADTAPTPRWVFLLPWFLLVISWVGFLIFLALGMK